MMGVGVALTMDGSSTSVMSYPLRDTTNSTALTSSKQLIHFLLSVRWPPTSYSLQRNRGRVKQVTQERLWEKLWDGVSPGHSSLGLNQTSETSRTADIRSNLTAERET
ncbi:uncharacterized, partial [Tachysurus ichikawai]